MTKQPKSEMVVVGFPYDLLDAKVAEQVRSSADRIRGKVKKTVEDIIEIGQDLLAVKETLPHGQFGPWLQAEFGWSERSAQNFMAVALEGTGRTGPAASGVRRCPGEIVPRQQEESERMTLRGRFPA